MTAAMNLLALDLGAESGRAMLGTLEAGTLRLTEVHRFPNGPVPLPTGLHWDVLGMWTEIRKGIGLAGQAAGGRLAGLGLDTWGVDFGLLDRHGELLGNPYHYRDARTDGMMEAAFQRVPRADIYAQTGIQFMQLNTLYQLLAMVLQRSPQLAAAETLLTMPDLFNYWLTGRAVSEFTIATTTQCFDTRRGAWARPLLQRLGIPDHIFPEIIQPGHVLGNLRPALAEELGIETTIPVIAPAAHDTGSAVAAVPAAGSDYAWISSGTWSIIGVNVTQPVINAQALECGVTNEGGVNGTFRLSKNLMGLWPVQEARRTWARQGSPFTYDELTHLASQAEALRTIIDLDHPDLLKPGDMPARVRALCAKAGQPIPESPGPLVRMLLEGLALKYRWGLERLERLTGRRLETVHIVGGGTRNRLLSQFAANATNRPVITGPVEATATGSLLVQAVSAGALQSMEEAREVVRRSFDVEIFEPDPSVRAAWDDAYARLLQVGETC
jgi:rhamnulokinase